MATEKRLIDVDKLKHKMNLEFLDRRNKLISLKDLFECIDDMPTVDAVEVVHGRWIEKQERIRMVEDDVDIYWVCSVCGATEIGKTNYCHNCGATMDGGV